MGLSLLSSGVAFIALTHTGRIVAAKRFRIVVPSNAYAPEVVALKEVFFCLLGFIQAKAG